MEKRFSTYVFSVRHYNFFTIFIKGMFKESLIVMNITGITTVLFAIFRKRKVKC